MHRQSPLPSFSNAYEAVLYTLFKQTLKSKLFKGFYKERCYVDAVRGYRDLIVVNRTETDLILGLEAIAKQLVQTPGNESPIWIGMSTNIADTTKDICLWAELDELAFGHYWFIIKGIRFKKNEIIFKVKQVRAIEDESTRKQNIPETPEGLNNIPTLQDFIQVVVGWGTDIKRNIYNFMSKDISKENLKMLLNNVLLLVITLLTASVHAVQFAGRFTIAFMIEFRKLLVAGTPIFLRIIDTCCKIVGGFFILLAMVWRDLRGGSKQRDNRPLQIKYIPPPYQNRVYGD